MNHISDRITKLRSLMKKHQIDAYLIPSADNHQSEYVGEHFKCREFITGFTGSAGTAIITQQEAGLWTDGRYFIQAETELAGSGITLYRMGNPGIPSVSEYLDCILPQNGSLGFDGRVIAMQEGAALAQKLAHKNVTLVYHRDLIDGIWEERPALTKAPAFLLSEQYSGESAASKLSRLREKMKSLHATAHILTTLDDIAWLLNIRGNDIRYSPLVLCYAIITMQKVHLFIDEGKLDNTVKAALSDIDTVLHPYHGIDTFLSGLSDDHTVLLDPERISYTLYHSIPKTIEKTEKTNPTILLKAVKNSTELKNIRNAHIKDGIAHTKFMYWLKSNFETETITEMSASEKLEELRMEQEGFLSPSFEPICAFQANAAMCHYTSSEETNCQLTAGNLFLTDTGGNYYEGSTDITRTVALGNISDELKFHFTTVLRSMINLAKANFLYGCSGCHLDVLARQPLWDAGLDYNHGTGHGVGYLLNIHEGPCSFRWRTKDKNTTPLEAGMIITDEPGIYIEGSHGIRIENELIVQKGNKNEYGQFMHFEPVTYVPIDLDAVNPDILQEAERAYLNDYHQKVYALLSPHLTDAEREWLTLYTRPI